MRTKKLMGILLMFGLIFQFSTCRKLGRQTILLENNSSDTIQAFLADPGWDHIYPDTLLPDQQLPIGYNLAPPGKAWVIASTGMGGRWEWVFSGTPRDTLSIFLLDYEALKGFSWQEIVEGYKVLKRYDLSLDDLKRLNRRMITYPPTEAMKDIKQFPPY